MLGAFTERLSIPPAFDSQFIYEREEHMVLQGPSGQEWDVQLLGTNTTLEFRHGWENFVHYHGLKLGDFVVFKYISKLCLKVQIFEKSGCEKDISAQKTNIDLDERCPDQPMLLIYLVCDEEKNDTAEPAPENRRRKKKRKSKLTGHSSKKYGHLLSSQKHMAMEIAAPFKSDKPFYKKVMKSWNVNDPHMLVRSNSLLLFGYIYFSIPWK
ncbi:putative B3 domain-containing protein Os03g0621600 [Cryptomeria japonica]|uniref:putative B3 domain-containing protein Os03g0621600 n=1 Tax=Cryptomeria japonica TaxID=3369 RepID=UPI0027D9D83E|nr:putative B3 domain-containing protein Os03g0621600 [Cryptomeria japonica]